MDGESGVLGGGGGGSAFRYFTLIIKLFQSADQE